MINFAMTTRGQRPIGLDIGNNSIKMLQLAANGGHFTVVAAREIPIDSAASTDEQARKRFAVSAIRRALAEGGFRGRNVVSCVPNDKLKITSVRLAEAGTDEVEEALRKEAVQRFGLDPDNDAIDYMLAGDVRQGDEMRNELILFAADNDRIKEQIELLEQAELKPVGLDALPCALFRSFERHLQRHEDQNHSAVFIDVGCRFTTVVFGRGRQITFIKQIEMGGEQFNQEVAAKLGVSLEEARMLRNKLRVERSEWAGPNLGRPSRRQVQGEQDAAEQQQQPREIEKLDPSVRLVMVDAIGAVAEKLAKEISLCFRYYTVTFRGKRVERAVFSGGEAYEQVLLNVMKRQLAVDVEVAQPLRGFDLMNVGFGSDRRSPLCEWAVAVGLSLKGWHGSTRQAEPCSAESAMIGETVGHERN
jgi:type IV pilus assembly protein PilM